MKFLKHHTAMLYLNQAAGTAYLLLAGRKAFWTVFVDPATADVVGFIALDSF